MTTESKSSHGGSSLYTMESGAFGGIKFSNQPEARLQHMVTNSPMIAHKRSLMVGRQKASLDLPFTKRNTKTDEHEKTVNRNTINQPDTSPATGSSGRGFKMKALNGDFDDIGDDDNGGGNEDKNNTTREQYENPYAFTLTQASKKYITLSSVLQMVSQYQEKSDSLRAYVIDPTKPRMRYWDAIITSMLLFTAIITPFEIAFLTPEFNFLFYINRLIDLTFLIDVFINFHLAYFCQTESKWVFDLQRIRRRYIHGWLIIDFISIVPFDIANIMLGGGDDSGAQGTILRFLRLIRLLKLLRIVRISRIISRWQSQVGVRHAVVSLIKFGLSLVFISHWAACLWTLQPELEDNTDFGDDSWLVAAGLQDSNAFTKYMAAFYWSSMTVTTIGYGDLSPKTTGERFIAIICMFFGGAVYAYIIGHICGLVGSMDEANVLFNKTMDHLNTYMAEVELAHEDRQIYRRFFLLSRNVFRHEFNQTVMKLMSPGLRAKFANHVHRQYIERVEFFASSARESDSFIPEVALNFDFVSFPAFEPIIKEGEFCETMYIIQKGLAARLGVILGSGKVFGKDMILHSARRFYYVRSLTFITTLCLTKDRMEAILNTGAFPETAMCIRRAAIKLALRREFVAYANAVREEIEKNDLEAGGTKLIVRKQPIHKIFGNNIGKRLLDLRLQQKLFEMSSSEEDYSHSDVSSDDDWENQMPTLYGTTFGGNFNVKHKSNSVNTTGSNVSKYSNNNSNNGHHNVDHSNGSEKDAGSALTEAAKKVPAPSRRKRSSVAMLTHLYRNRMSFISNTPDHDDASNVPHPNGDGDNGGDGTGPSNDVRDSNGAGVGHDGRKEDRGGADDDADGTGVPAGLPMNGAEARDGNNAKMVAGDVSAIDIKALDVNGNRNGVRIGHMSDGDTVDNKHSTTPKGTEAEQGSAGEESNDNNSGSDSNDDNDDANNIQNTHSGVDANSRKHSTLSLAAPVPSPKSLASIHEQAVQKQQKRFVFDGLKAAQRHVDNHSRHGRSSKHHSKSDSHSEFQKMEKMLLSIINHQKQTDKHLHVVYNRMDTLLHSIDSLKSLVSRGERKEELNATAKAAMVGRRETAVDYRILENMQAGTGSHRRSLVEARVQHAQRRRRSSHMPRHRRQSRHHHRNPHPLIGSPVHQISSRLRANASKEQQGGANNNNNNTNTSINTNTKTNTNTSTSTSTSTHAHTNTNINTNTNTNTHIPISYSPAVPKRA